MTKLRVAIVTETFLPCVNGVATRLDRSVREMTAAGDEVLVVAPGSGSWEHHGAQVFGAGGFPLPIYREVSVALPRPAVSRALKAFRPDVIHVVNPAVLGWSGIYYARTRRVPLICSFHTQLPRYLQHYGLGFMERPLWDFLRSAHNQARVNLCISRPMERELIDHGIERVSVGWRGGVDVELFSPTRADGMMRARLCGGRQAQTLLLYVGRLSAEKGIESLRDTLDAMPGAALAIVGDGPYRSTLERHFEGRQAYFHGYLHGEDLAAAYASSDVFMFPSRSETLGLVLLEAMASGCPVVAARAGGIPEVVTDGATGLLFDPSDESQPLDHLRRLLADPVLKQRLRLAGHLQAQRWTWKAATAELRGHYLDAIGGGLAAVA